jgi:Xaa-Pro aminopeptidase
MAHPEFPDFPKEEYEKRRINARKLMAQAGLQALFVTSEIHYRYLTGHWTQMFLNRSRVMFAVFGLHNDPILIVPEAEKGGAEQTAWTTDIRTYAGTAKHGGFFDAWVSVVQEAFVSLGISRGRVGIELGSPERLGMAAADFDSLRASLREIQFVDSSEIFFRLRVIKSAGEIECMRKSAEITSEAFDRCLPQIKIGMTERDVFGLMATVMMKLGAERPGYIPVTFHSPRDVPQYRRAFLGGPTDRRLEPNDVIDIDAGCIYKGYWSDFNRTFSVGKPPKRLQEGYRIINEAIRHTVERIRPGYPVVEILKSFRRDFEKAKMQDSGIGRMGHGLGLDMPERPSISDQDEFTVEVGMTLCIEPNFFLPDYGVVLAEEEIVVTEHGCDLMSRIGSPDLISI